MSLKNCWNLDPAIAWAGDGWMPRGHGNLWKFDLGPSDSAPMQGFEGCNFGMFGCSSKGLHELHF